MTTTAAPIQVFSVSDFGIPLKSFLSATKPIFDGLPFDEYDCKKEQIVFLQTHLPEETKNADEMFYRYYKAEIGFQGISPFYLKLNEAEKEQFNRIKPYRRRAVSRFLLQYTPERGWVYERIPTSSFSQTYAKIKEDHFDFRSLPRIFSEIDEEAVSSKIFDRLMKGVASKVRSYHPDVDKLDITVHHVRVMTHKDKVTSNSPEGIHQDGFDYIVSALVVERVDVDGGESQIFGEDKQTKILTTTLQPGQGILQPDLNTSLWHSVSPIHVMRKESGYRSSIGFDIALVRS